MWQFGKNIEMWGCSVRRNAFISFHSNKRSFSHLNVPNKHVAQLMCTMDDFIRHHFGVPTRRILIIRWSRCVQQVEVEKTRTGILSFLGIVRYYQRFVPHLADLSQPLSVERREPFQNGAPPRMRPLGPSRRYSSLLMYWSTSTRSTPRCCRSTRPCSP